MWETESKAFLKSMWIIASPLCSALAILMHCNMLIRVSLITSAVLYIGFFLGSAIGFLAVPGEFIDYFFSWLQNAFV